MQGAAKAEPCKLGAEMDETAVYLFNHGENAYAYRALGAHERNTGGIRYWEFSVFAPNAVRISVVGDFNNWKQGANPMEKFGETGCWSCRIAEAGKGDRYKFAITGRVRIPFGTSAGNGKRASRHSPECVDRRRIS